MDVLFAVSALHAIAADTASSIIVDRCNDTHAVLFKYGSYAVVETDAPINGSVGAAPWVEHSNFGAIVRTAAPEVVRGRVHGRVLYWGIEQMATTASGSYDNCEITTTEVWCADRTCAHGMMSDQRACVHEDVVAIAANDEHVYLATRDDVFAFAYVNERNWGLEQLVGRPGRGGTRGIVGPKTVGYRWGGVTALAANTTHVIVSVGKTAYAMNTLPTTPERVHASWTPKVCDAYIEETGCVWTEYGSICKPRSKCPRKKANDPHSDTKCVNENRHVDHTSYAHHNACEGVAIVRDGNVVACVDKPDCEQYNGRANACEHVERPRAQRQRRAADPCGGAETGTPIPSPSPTSSKVTCEENEFVSDGVCIECARCGAGMRLVAWCGVDHDTVCGDCPPHTFEPRLVHNETQCRPTNGCKGATRVRDGDCTGEGVPWQHTIWIGAAAYALIVGGGKR